MTEDEVINKRKNCPHVILSRARGFRSKTPVPTCNRFHTNYTDNNLIGTYEQCCDVDIEGNCKIKGIKEYEEERIKALTKKNMNDVDFIEKYCVVKDSSGKVNKIHLKDYQKKFIMYINKLKKKL